MIDCGFSLEDDDDLGYDMIAPGRNAATLTALRSADRVVAVGSADPVGISRLIRELPRLVEVLEPEATARVHVVANRLRDGLLPGNPRSSGGAGTGEARFHAALRRGADGHRQRPTPRMGVAS